MKWEATKTKTKAALLAARCELIKQVKHVPLQFQFFIAFFIYFFFLHFCRVYFAFIRDFCTTYAPLPTTSHGGSLAALLRFNALHAV